MKVLLDVIFYKIKWMYDLPYTTLKRNNASLRIRAQALLILNSVLAPGYEYTFQDL